MSKKVYKRIVNTKALKDRLKELSYTQNDLANYMDLSRQATSKILNDRSGESLTAGKIYKLIDFLGIQKEEFSRFFFNE